MFYKAMELPLQPIHRLEMSLTKWAWRVPTSPGAHPLGATTISSRPCG